MTVILVFMTNAGKEIDRQCLNPVQKSAIIPEDSSDVYGKHHSGIVIRKEYNYNTDQVLVFVRC